MGGNSFSISSAADTSPAVLSKAMALALSSLIGLAPSGRAPDEVSPRGLSVRYAAGWHEEHAFHFAIVRFQMTFPESFIRKCPLVRGTQEECRLENVAPKLR